MSGSDPRELRQRLLERFVAGEIDKPTYDQMLAELQTLSLRKPSERRAGPPAAPPRKPSASGPVPVARPAGPPPAPVRRPPAPGPVPVAQLIAPPPRPAPGGRWLSPPVLVAAGFAVVMAVLVPLVVLLLRPPAGGRGEDRHEAVVTPAPKTTETPRPLPATTPAGKADAPRPQPGPKNDVPAQPDPVRDDVIAVPSRPLEPPGADLWANARRTLVIDRAGDGRLTVECRMTADRYTKLKAGTPNKAVLLRKIGLRRHWADYQDISEPVFDDTTSTLTLKCVQRGVARIRQGDLWETEVRDGRQLATIQNGLAVFTSSSRTDLGLANLTISVQAPPGATDLQWTDSSSPLTYRLPPGRTPEGNRAEARFTWEVRPQVMTCLSKLYSNRKFAYLWVARATLRNSGNQTLKKYRVHFRVPDFTTAWGPTEVCEQVVPGQTVVDAYFPQFDLDKVARLTSPRDTTVEVEYWYVKGDGAEEHETKSLPVKLLGRNEVVFSSMKAAEAVDFQDRFDYAPLFLASFVTPHDPVIKRVAGWVSGQAGGGEFSLRDKDAQRFMEALYTFIAANKIVYQTPDGGLFDNQAGQFVKYGRDVLRDKAGTCIDLAILYASVCRAVGLKVKMFLVPNHCFPAVVLPENNRLLAVETSAVGRSDFNGATRMGKEEVEKARTGTDFYEVDVKAQHDAGVGSPDLAELQDEGELEKWGIHPVEGDEKVPLTDRKLEGGTWRATINVNRVNAASQRVFWKLQFFKNYSFQSTITEQGNNPATKKGTYVVKSGILTLRYSPQVVETYDVIWEKKDRIRVRMLAGIFAGQDVVLDRND